MTWGLMGRACARSLVAVLVAAAPLIPGLSPGALAGDRQAETPVPTSVAPSETPAAITPTTHVLEPAVAPSVGAVLREVPRDMWRFVSKDTAVVLAAGGGAALIAHTWDDDLAKETEVSLQLVNALEPGNTYGTFAAMIAARSPSTVLDARPDKATWPLWAPIWSVRRS